MERGKYEERARKQEKGERERGIKGEKRENEQQKIEIGREGGMRERDEEKGGSSSKNLMISIKIDPHSNPQSRSTFQFFGLITEIVSIRSMISSSIYLVFTSLSPISNP